MVRLGFLHHLRQSRRCILETIRVLLHWVGVLSPMRFVFSALFCEAKEFLDFLPIVKRENVMKEWGCEDWLLEMYQEQGEWPKAAELLQERQLWVEAAECFQRCGQTSMVASATANAAVCGLRWFNDEKDKFSVNLRDK
eukprot:1735662-Rhodomonas_salina.1